MEPSYSIITYRRSSERHTTPNLLREKKPDKLVKGPNDTCVTRLAIAS